jgi:class 3 adenylate cyclase
LLIDVVGYSKLLVNEQIELLQELKQIVRSTECFRAAEARGELIPIPTGDGMALIFLHSPEEPARCALEISKALQDHPSMQLRMGVHSGPVNRVTDVNEKTNIAGSGINVAQRVLDCGDAGADLKVTSRTSTQYYKSWLQRRQAISRIRHYLSEALAEPFRNSTRVIYSSFRTRPCGRSSTRRGRAPSI